MSNQICLCCGSTIEEKKSYDDDVSNSRVYGDDTGITVTSKMEKEKEICHRCNNARKIIELHSHLG